MKRTALITGGTRGIGYGIAQALAREGYALAINGIRSQADVQYQLDTLKKYNTEIMYCRGDIGNSSERNEIVAKAFDHFKAINLLVNNAGVAPRVRKDILVTEEEDFDYLMNINLKGTFFLTQQVANLMLKEKNNQPDYTACIITITSISAEVASLNRAEYCMSKAGLSMMTKLFATALSEAHIPVYEVRPGIIETDMTARVKEKYDKLIDEGLTLEKRWGTADDVGKIVAALARGDIPYSTGQIITPDGGLTLKRL